MVQHVVLMSFKPSTQEAEIILLEDSLLGLRNIVKDKSAYKFGRNIINSERAFDFGLVSSESRQVGGFAARGGTGIKNPITRHWRKQVRDQHARFVLDLVPTFVITRQGLRRPLLEDDPFRSIATRARRMTSIAQCSQKALLLGFQGVDPQCLWCRPGHGFSQCL